MWFLSYRFVHLPVFQSNHLLSTEPDIMLSVSKQPRVHVNCWKDSTEIPAIFYSLKYLHRFRYVYRCDILSAERFERGMNVFCEIAMRAYQRCVWWVAVNMRLAFFCFAFALWVSAVLSVNPVIQYLKRIKGYC